VWKSCYCCCRYEGRRRNSQWRGRNVVALMEELVAGIGCGRKKEKLEVTPPNVRWSSSGYAGELWWRWWWSS
jgi:hypothetical protein